MTEADLGTAPSKVRRPIDLALNIGVAVLLLVLIGGGAYFGYAVYRNNQAEFTSSATEEARAFLACL